MESKQYDIIIIGSGAGGGTLARALSETGKSILVIERGDFLKRSKDNWDAYRVFKEEVYHTDERWLDGSGKPFRPGQAYLVGGQTKVYGAALFRMRKEDFGEIQHEDGISPAWPISYEDLEPYYARVENLYNVHGKGGEDKTEPERSSDFPYPAVSHEPRIQEIHNALEQRGFNPFHMPMGVDLNETDFANSPCIRCNTCDGFPCMVNAKSDADIFGIRPALAHGNVTLVVNTQVVKIETDSQGKTVTGVIARHRGAEVSYKGDIVILCAGAINSAALLLRSANGKHPNGLANSSGKVGRHLMFHINSAMLAISFAKKNPTVFQKTMAMNDFYYGDYKSDFEYPLGHIQLLGKATPEILKADQPMAPMPILRAMSSRSVDWWMTTEDLGLESNRVSLTKDGNIQVSYSPTNLSAHKRLTAKLKKILKSIGFQVFLTKRIPLAGVAHQCGTTRFGDDPKNSVLDPFCKSHDLENLYVVDGGFFPSSSAVNPALTIFAQALRVADHLKERLG